MAYLARRDIIFDGSTFHITWQCHNGSWFLEDDATKQIYYDLLVKYKDRYSVKIYSYCFMDNHPHMTGLAGHAESLSRFMQAVNSQFAKKVNNTLKRRGQVVMDRYKSPVIQSDEALLTVMVYGDLNPQRAGKIQHPKEYRWSSYRYYAEGKADPLITPAPSYLALGNNDDDRRRQYQLMVTTVLAADADAKRDYSTTKCIGDPDWVKMRYDEIREIQRTKRTAYQLRQQRSLHTGSSP